MKSHADWCEADTGHDLDCSTATRLARLTAFAEAVRDEFACTIDRDNPRSDDHVDDCLYCYAVQSLEPPA
jgi:hypothetical protein